jgi:arabinose-5-phosphate isomerase
MSRKGLGLATVLDDAGALLGVITDGDLRRLMERDPDPLSRLAEEVMHKGGVCISADELATAALGKLEEKRITSLMVCNGDGVVGVLHVHDLWGVGLF